MGGSSSQKGERGCQIIVEFVLIITYCSLALESHLNPDCRFSDSCFEKLLKKNYLSLWRILLNLTLSLRRLIDSSKAMSLIIRM